MTMPMRWRRIFKKPDKEAEKRLREELEREGGVEKKDIPAMILSAYLVFIPIALGLLLLLYLLVKLFFGV